ncbi:LPXTG cell wall anchor domain-containing protein, partial [Ligilactobacillus agilis]
DAMSNLSDDDKAAAKEAVANATDEAGVTTAKDNAQSLDTAKGDANKAIDAMSNLSDADKAAAKEAVANATDEAGVTAAKNNAQTLDELKLKVNNANDGFESLNVAQHEFFKNEVLNATDVDKVNTIYENMLSLNDAMASLSSDTTNDSVVTNSSNYINADVDKQEAFRNALNVAQTLLSQNGENADLSKVTALQEALKVAKEALNGETNLANSKQIAKRKVDDLSYLNEAQKLAVKQQIDAVNKTTAIEPIVNDAKQLDLLVLNLREAADKAVQLKDSVKYLNADSNLKATYDKVLELAQALVAKDGANADLQMVESVLADLTKAQSALNGKEIVVLAGKKDESTMKADSKANMAGTTVKSTAKQVLPQTGDEENNNLSVMGAMLATVAGLFGLAGVRKKKEDK